MASGEHRKVAPPETKHLLAPTQMRGAIGLAAMVVVLGIFLPRVLAATETFLLTLLDRATAVVETIEPRETAQILRPTPAR